MTYLLSDIDPVFQNKFSPKQKASIMFKFYSDPKFAEDYTDMIARLSRPKLKGFMWKDLEPSELNIGFEKFWTTRKLEFSHSLGRSIIEGLLVDTGKFINDPHFAQRVINAWDYPIILTKIGYKVSFQAGFAGVGYTGPGVSCVVKLIPVNSKDLLTHPIRVKLHMVFQHQDLLM